MKKKYISYQLIKLKFIIKTTCIGMEPVILYTDVELPPYHDKRILLHSREYKR